MKLPAEVSALQIMAEQVMFQAKSAKEEGDQESSETLYGIATRIKAIFEESAERILPNEWFGVDGELLPEWKFIDRLDAEYDVYEASR